MSKLLKLIITNYPASTVGLGAFSGGIIGTTYGLYEGRFYSRSLPYLDRIVETTSSGILYGLAGTVMGGFFGFTLPISLPIATISAIVCYKK